MKDDKRQNYDFEIDFREWLWKEQNIQGNLVVDG
jgi:hypothetical protein